VTLHRPSNVDDYRQLAHIVEALCQVAQGLPLVFPVHPRTKQRLARYNLGLKLEEAGVRLIEPLSYRPFMSLVSHAAAIITDSGGLQEETTYLGIPCLTLRENTERPITVTEGTNRLVRAETLAMELQRALSTPRASRPKPEYWDGHSAARCLDDLRRRSGPALLPSARKKEVERAAELSRLYPSEDRRSAKAGSSYRRSS